MCVSDHRRSAACQAVHMAEVPLRPGSSPSAACPVPLSPQAGDVSCLASCLASLQRVMAQAPVTRDVSSLPSCPLHLCCTPCNPPTPPAAPLLPSAAPPSATPSALCYASCNPSARPLTPLLHALSAQAGDAACLASCLASLQRVMSQAPGAGGLPGLGLGGNRQLNHHGAVHALLNRCEV